MAVYRDIDADVRIGGSLLLPTGSINLGSNITLNTNGTITATTFSGSFTGNGSALTNLSSSNMAGVLLLDGTRTMTNHLGMAGKEIRLGSYGDPSHSIKYQLYETDGTTLVDGPRLTGHAGVELFQANGLVQLAVFRSAGVKINAPLTVTTSVTSTTINATGNVQESGTNLSAKYALQTINITAGTGLTGGGALSATRTLNVDLAGTGVLLPLLVESCSIRRT
jgi:hypothetical protein